MQTIPINSWYHAHASGSWNEQGIKKHQTTKLYNLQSCTSNKTSHIPNLISQAAIRKKPCTGSDIMLTSLLQRIVGRAMLEQRWVTSTTSFCSLSYSLILSCWLRLRISSSDLCSLMFSPSCCKVDFCLLVVTARFCNTASSRSISLMV